MRLALEEQPFETSSGKKYVIHNYGHGGGGITLSWGCASIVTEMVEKLLVRLRQSRATPSIAVLGTGVIGLTVATELRRKWPTLPLSLYAKDLDVRSTTSFMAGGQFEPSGVFQEYRGKEKKRALALYLRRSRDRIVELQNSGQRTLFGVAERKNYTLDHAIKAFDEFTPQDVVPLHRKGALPFEKLNMIGREYSTWLMNPAILLPKLAADLVQTSVQFKQRLFESKQDVMSLPENILINCTGYGAKKLFGDEKLVAQRGHLVILRKTQPKQFYFFSGGCANRAISYVFCRQDDIVVGGTVQSGREAVTPDDEDALIFQRLLANGRELFDGHPAACRT
ncbi:FAD-dependent oxidoreductase [Hyalangium sp.]|uniref:FAD-dependent oxidoreductase n=1 Tax=Hyalangium sp. TaxID=2028555 RepID=UPI002D33F356|nr:FAD-dependent oxidoreductase [Hyalangium sp.]HYH96049.1 FAD-dependent oxidoreductase [Hyalangium sp.]